MEMLSVSYSYSYYYYYYYYSRKAHQPRQYPPVVPPQSLHRAARGAAAATVL